MDKLAPPDRRLSSANLTRMLVYAGIDEAGYGPMLGPLCVGATAFVVADADAKAGAPDLWARLAHVICRDKRDARRRIAVDDSKKLKGANLAVRVHPLKHLERAVLAFDATRDGRRRALPACDADLFDRLAAQVAARPWYASTTTLPVAHGADEMGIAVGRLHRGLTAAGIRCETLACETVHAEDFNRGVERTGTKASVNFEAASRHLGRIWDRWPDAHPRVIVDRQGGRAHYREELRTAFPEASIRILAESDTISRYRLDRDGSRLTVSFETESERKHLPAALASMTAKYVRELLMTRMNRFFQGHLPELRPTAGYVQDGRRYLHEIEPVIARLGLPRGALVRSV